MSNIAKEMRLAPDITSIESSQPSLLEHGFFPPSYCLIVTTNRAVYSWDMDGITELFRSKSEGIVAARKLSSDSEMLAVADSQVVILHDTNKGMQRSYRLKGSEGQVRLLKFAGNSTKNLFFTTTLRNSVQSYSLKDSKVLDPSDSHPSPPSVFALSCTSHLLLSTSARPPTIYLRNLGTHMPPILLRPRCSSSAVVAADFHPETANLFLLGFADGSAGVYDASLMFRNKGSGDHLERPAGSGTGGEIGTIKGLHVVGSEAGRREIGDDLDAIAVQAEASGITAVALVPGHRALAVTVGADGKCCVVNFTQPSRKKAVLLRTWHLRRPATSLSVMYSKVAAHDTQLDGVDEHDVPDDKDYCIAVGRQDGKVLVFDLGGKPLGKQVLDPKGARVVDVEWAKREIDAAFAHVNSSMPDTWKNVPKRKSLGTEVIKKTLKADLPVGVHHESVEKSRDPILSPSRYLPTSSKATSKVVNHLDLPHGVYPTVRNLVGTPERNSGQSVRLDGSSRSNLLSSTSLVVEFSNSPPPVPPRPTLKPGGKLSERRSMTAREHLSQPNGSDPDTCVNNRLNMVHDVTPTKSAIPTTSPSRNLLFGLRSPKGSQTESWKQRLRDRPNHVFPRADPDSQESFDPPEPLDQPASSRPADFMGRKESSTDPDFVSPKSQPSSKRIELPAIKSSTASLRSYKTANSKPEHSENSIDTVVDWSTTASSRPLNPSLRGPSPARTVAQLSFLHERPPSNAPKDERSKTKKKGHVRIDASTQTSLSPRYSWSQLSQDTAPADAVVYWPSLRKSPRIPDINAGIVSATASILDFGGYTEPSSPERSQQDSTISPEKLKRHSSSSSRKDRYIPPRLPLKVSPTTANLRRGNTAHVCPCEPQIQTIITSSLDTFRAEMEQGFKAQRLWLEGLVRGKENGEFKLEEENRPLKAE